VTIGVTRAHKICAKVTGWLALVIARPNQRPPGDLSRMADDLQKVVDTLREKGREAP
jgi:hypothetical protein